MSSELLSRISEARRFFREVIVIFSNDEMVTEDMMTIFDEALSNALKHAYPKGARGEVKISLYVDEKGGRRYFILTVFDRGRIPEGIPKDLKNYRLNVQEYLKNTSNIGGMGLSIISRLADRAYWRRVKGGKYFVAIKRFK